MKSSLLKCYYQLQILPTLFWSETIMTHVDKSSHILLYIKECSLFNYSYVRGEILRHLQHIPVFNGLFVTY